MAMPNITGNVIATGFNCHVRVGENPSAAEPVAFVTSFQANEDFQVQEATVLGNLGPVSIDPQGYNCSITLASFVPAKKLLDGTQQYEDGGKKCIMDYMPTRATFMDSASINKIAYMDFYNRKAGKILAAFEGVIVSSEGIQAEGNTYVRSNVQMRALSKNDPPR
jgi:hypothetical protein